MGSATHGIIDSKKLIGAYMDRGDASHLSLIAVTNQTSITETITKVLMDLLACYDKEKMMDAIAINMANKWQEFLMVNGSDPGWRTHKKQMERWAEYKFQIGRDLKKKGVSITDIASVLRKLDIETGMGD